MAYGPLERGPSGLGKPGYGNGGRSVLKDVHPATTFLLHDIYPSSVEAALQIVDALEAEGYWFVTVEELLELNGHPAQSGGYVPGPGGCSSVLPHHGYHFAQDLSVGAVDRLVIVIFRQ